VIGAVPATARTLRGRVEVGGGDAATWAEPVLESVFRQGEAEGGPLIALDRTAGGYELRIARFARFRLSADGRQVACRPEPDAGPAWSWQRVLAAHALPFAALLQGVEVLHAGAVALDTAGGTVAIGIVAGSQGGKSSLAVNLALRGATLLTDDALAVVVEDGRPLAHPGVAAATLRAAEVERLRALGLFERLEVVGEAGGSVRVLLERAAAPAPLGALYWLERVPAGAPVAFTRLEPDPRRVLTSTINLVLQGPERLARHFDVSTQVAGSVPLFLVSVPRDVGAARLAADIEGHARRCAGG
jgi:hypothetical protein